MFNFYNEIKKFKVKETRLDLIKKYVRDKEVLDLGSANYDEPQYFLFEEIRKRAKYVLGIDIDKKALEKCREKGYNIIEANVENLNLNKKFDVVVACDIIEHVDNQGLMLKSIQKHLKKGGILIISTPNCGAILTFLEILIFGNIAMLMNPEHKLWHNYSTLKFLLEKYNFKIIDGNYMLCKDYKFLPQKFRFFLRYVFQIFFVAIRKDFSPHLVIASKYMGKEN